MSTTKNACFSSFSHYYGSFRLIHSTSPLSTCQPLKTSTYRPYYNDWLSIQVSSRLQPLRKLCVEVATTTLQNFSLACFGASLPTLHNTLSCFIYHSSFSAFLAERNPIEHSQSIPLTGYLPVFGPVIGWVASPRKLCIPGGKPTILSRNFSILSHRLLVFWIMQSCQTTLPTGIA